MHAAILDAGVEQSTTTVMSVTSDEVPQILAASDLGLLLRENSIVNAVASPVKFGEYMAAGIPLLISQGIGDYSDAVRDQGLGICVDIGTSDENLQRMLAEGLPAIIDHSLRERCRAFAYDNLRWDNYADELFKKYRLICE